MISKFSSVVHNGVPMMVRRVGWLGAMVLPILVWMACGQVYRPVVIPCSEGGVPGCPVEANPAPSNFHEVFAISTNAPNYPGGAMQIDVSGDSIIGETPTYDASKPNLGDNPTHAAIFPNNSRVFVASAGSVVPGGIDVVSSFTPVFQSTLATGLGTVNTIDLPAGSQPVFVNTTQNNALFVANFATNSVSLINTASSVVTNTAPVGANPTLIAETPNAFKLYVANQGNNTISTLSPIDLSGNTSNGLVAGFTGITPVWMVARGDSQKVYVLTAGDGQLWTIDVATDTVTSSLPVGVGANYIFYDPNLNRLYVTNPITATVYVFSDTSATDTPTQLATFSFGTGSIPCPNGCMPVSVTALQDGSRFYVASEQTPTTCPDLNVAGACVISGLTVFDAASLTVKYPSAPTLTLLAGPPPCTVTPTNSCVSGWPFAAGQYAVAPVASCASAVLYPALYSPTIPRFRVVTVAAEDSSRVYVSMCDAGAIAVVNTTDGNTNNSGTGLPPDTLVTDLLEAPEANSATAVQTPIFLFTGQ
jgi:YVTN family beta-propeller protein